MKDDLSTLYMILNTLLQNVSTDLYFTSAFLAWLERSWGWGGGGSGGGTCRPAPETSGSDADMASCFLRPWRIRPRHVIYTLLFRWSRCSISMQPASMHKSNGLLI